MSNFSNRGRVDPASLVELQQRTSTIRNFCILAHVDHGKTTLSDNLISSNGIISPKMSGKLRYLDSTEEEQQRGITMHSSAISLLFQMENKNADKLNEQNYLINLIDCPGHIDFSSDVSTAARLCDGAMIIVDVLEGICTQTRAVLHKALKEKMTPFLVLNKIDKFILELQLTPSEAFQHLRRIVENVNAVAFTLLKSELLQEGVELSMDVNSEESEDPLVRQWTFSVENGNVLFASARDSWGFGAAKFINLWTKKLGLNRNVLKKYIFDDFSLNLETKKISRCDPSDSTAGQPMFVMMVLNPIWDIYKLIVKDKDLQKAVKKANDEFGVEIPPREINPRDPRSTLQSIFRRWLPLSDAVLRTVVRCIPDPIAAQAFRLPILLKSSPDVSWKSEDPVVKKIMASVGRITDCVKNCSGFEASKKGDVPLLVFISKMVPVRLSDLTVEDVKKLRDSTDAAMDDPVEEIFMAVGRVYSGVLATSDHRSLFVLDHRHDPLKAATTLSEDVGKDMNFKTSVPQCLINTATEVSSNTLGLYMVQGPSVFPTRSVSAGNIVGIVGLSDRVLKTATLSDTWACYPMKAITFQSRPMVRVAIEAVRHQDLEKVETGLKMLHRYDPVVEVGIDEGSGQRTMTCLGELHLEQCVKTLREKFARCELRISDPLVPFRETIIAFETPESNLPQLPPPWSDLPDLSSAKHGRIRLEVLNRNMAISFKCFPLDTEVVEKLEKLGSSQFSSDFQSDRATYIYQLTNQFVSDFQRKLEAMAVDFSSKEDTCLVEECYQDMLNTVSDPFFNSFWSDLNSGKKSHLRDFLCFSSHENLTNLLTFDPLVFVTLWHEIPLNKSEINEQKEQDSYKITRKFCPGAFHRIWNLINHAVCTGFRSVCAAGPLMKEPVRGVGITVEKIDINLSFALSSGGFLSSDFDQLKETGHFTLEKKNQNKDHTINESSIGTGQLISVVRDGLNVCLLSCPMRVVEPIYLCSLQCDQSQLGSLYGVLSKQRGDVVEEDIIEGTSLFVLKAYLPVVNSFGFAQELLNKTSGSGTTPQLDFSHWQKVDMDPFWRPVTEEEREEFGEAELFRGKSDRNLARNLIDQVRKRKGLAVEEQVVASAEKQRTLNKKK